MHTRLYNFLEDFKAIYDLQYGFRKNHSTDHALLSIVEEIRSNIKAIGGVQGQNTSWAHMKVLFHTELTRFTVC